MNSMRMVWSVSSSTAFVLAVVFYLTCLSLQAGNQSFMEVSKMTQIRKVSSNDFLKHYEFSRELHCSNTSDLVDFRNCSREFVDHLVDVIFGQHMVSADFFMGVYCFCPENLLEGDDQHVFHLYSQLFRVLEGSDCLSRSDSLASIEEFKTFVVDVRARHAGSERSAEKIEERGGLSVSGGVVYMDYPPSPW